MKNLQVVVRYHEKSLTVGGTASTPITLDEGDSVQWTFLGIPNHCVPQISFELPGNLSLDDVQDMALGPFTSLVQRRSQVLGQGNTGRASDSSVSYRYRAQVFMPDGTLLARSSVECLVNQVRHPEFPTEIDVQLERQGKAWALVISTDSCKLRPNGVVTWNFFVPNDFATIPWIPEIRFKPHCNLPLNHFFGPFLNLSVASVSPHTNPRKNGRVMKVIGSGNSGHAGSFSYAAAIVAAACSGRLVVTSEDPAVDNSGVLTISP